MKNYAFVLIVLSGILAFSCVKEPEKPDPDISLGTVGLYVLNEGLFSMNNSELTRYDYSRGESVSGFFELKNGRKMGDTGTDIAIYGSKLYIVVSGSSQLEVVDPQTGESIRQIPFFDGEKPRQPRRIAFHGSKAYVCSFDGTVAVIDTSTLIVEKHIGAGKNPDGIAIANNKIYVSNSGGLDFPIFDNTISVIDIGTMTEVKRIEVGVNPYTIIPDSYGDLYVVSRGNYNTEKSKLQVIDSNTDQLKYTFPGIEVFDIAIKGDTAYAYFHDYAGGTGSQIILIDIRTKTVINDNFISDGTVINTIYGIAVDKVSGDVFIADATDFVSTGKVVCFDSSGKKKYSFVAGLNPGRMVFLYERK
jgi:YVTN family beta-propeller protein